MTNELSKTAPLTPEKVKAELYLDLTKLETGVQALNDAESKLVYNEDNLQVIADFIKQVKKAEDACENKRKALKEPSLEEGKTIDAGAKLVATELAVVKKRAHEKYDKMCRDIAERQRLASIEKERKERINSAIVNTAMKYSQDIAAATTDAELVAIEKRMGLEKTKSTVYQEMLPLLVLAIDSLRPLSSIQKEKIRQLKQLDKEIETTESDEDKMLLLSQKEELEGHIQDNREMVQQTALQQTGIAQMETGEQIFPTVKPRRRTWKHACPDIEKLFKKHPELVILSLNDEKIKEILKAKIDAGETKDKEKIEYDDVIIFYVEKTF